MRDEGMFATGSTRFRVPFVQICDRLLRDMDEAENIELRIDDVVYRGRGLARVDGLVYFVDGVLPGELVRARIIKRKKKSVEAELLEVVEPAAERIEPLCALAGLCPGCCYQHVDYELEVALKQKHLLNLLEKIGGCSDANCREPIGSSPDLGYRNKIMLHVGLDGDRKLIGYFGKDNKSIMDIPVCPLAAGPLNDLLAERRGDKEFMSGLRARESVIFRYTEHDGALCWRDSAGPPQSRLVEKTSLGDLSVPIRSFFQVNTNVYDTLFEVVGGLVKGIGPSSVIDLYCGVGTFALSAAAIGVEAVLGVDSDKRATKAAIRNAASRGITNAEFACAPVVSILRKALEKVDLKSTAIIVDPPRIGMESDVIRILCDCRPTHIIYVSCAADTMARDVKILSGAGYRVVETGLVDMFPRTPYFESVTHLSLG